MTRYGHAMTLTALVWVVVVGSVAAGGRQERFDRSYDNLQALEINADTFDVDIRSGGGNVITVRGEGIPDGVSVDDRVRRHTAVIHIQGRSSVFSRRDAVPVLTVVVPTGIDLDVETVSGSVRASDVQGRIRVRTVGGRVSIAGAGGDLRIRTASGAIDVTRFVGSLVTDSSSGRTVLRDCRGIVTVETASGGITAENLQLSADALFTSSSGSIDVDILNALSDIRYALQSNTGTIRVGDRRGEGRMNGGQGRFLVRAESVSGTVAVY